MNLKQTLESMRQLEAEYNLPWEVFRVFGRISMFGSQICFGNENDYVDAEEVKLAVEILAQELGGKVTWQKEGKK